MDLLAVGLISYYLLDKKQTGGANYTTIHKITQLTKKYIKENKLPDTFILELTGDHRLQNKLNKLYKNLLKRKQIGGAGKDGKDDDLCPICTDPLIDDIQKLPCGHEFHNDCIEKWFQRSNLCPICRRASGRTLPQAVVDQQEQEQELMNSFYQLPQDMQMELVRQYYRHQQMEIPAWARAQPINTTRTYRDIARRRTLEREQRERETYYGGLIVFAFLIILYTVRFMGDDNQTGNGKKGYQGRPRLQKQRKSNKRKRIKNINKSTVNRKILEKRSQYREKQLQKRIKRINDNTILLQRLLNTIDINDGASVGSVLQEDELQNQLEIPLIRQNETELEINKTYKKFKIQAGTHWMGVGTSIAAFKLFLKYIKKNPPYAFVFLIIGLLNIQPKLMKANKVLFPYVKDLGPKQYKDFMEKTENRFIKVQNLQELIKDILKNKKLKDKIQSGFTRVDIYSAANDSVEKFHAFGIDI